MKQNFQIRLEIKKEKFKNQYQLENNKPRYNKEKTAKPMSFMLRGKISNIETQRKKTVPIIKQTIWKVSTTTIQHHSTTFFVDLSWRRATDEDRRCGRKFWRLCIFYLIKAFLKLPLAVSFSAMYVLTNRFRK